MGDKRLTLLEFIKSTGLVMEVKDVLENPDMGDAIPGAKHYQVRISRPGYKGRVLLHFSKGPALKGPPTLSEVLDNIASDSSSFENARSFEDWAQDLGYDPDSRKAHKVYKAVESQVKSLKALLTPEEYQTLLYKVERE